MFDLRRIALPSVLFASALMVGCSSSPPARFYTLQPAPQAMGTTVPRVEYQLEITPVTVPGQADQPQIMLRMEDQGGALTAMYSDRWSAPLADEIRAALADTLTGTLGALDVRSIAPAADVPVWRVQVDVQRFDMISGGPARLDATWRVRPLKVQDARALICRSLIEIPVDSANVVESLVQAQQRALVLLGNTVASSIQSGGVKATPAGSEVQMLGCT